MQANNPITTVAPATCIREEEALSGPGEFAGTSATGPSATGPPAGASVGVDGPSLDGAGALEGDLAGDLAGVLAVGGAAGGVLVLGAGAGVFLGTAAVPGGGGGAMFSIPGVSIGSLTCSTEML